RYGGLASTLTFSRSYVATEILRSAAPIQRWHARKPGTRWRSGRCSVSYQSLNSSSAARPMFIAAISVPFAMIESSVLSAHALERRHAELARALGEPLHPLFVQRNPVRPAMHDFLGLG